MRTNKTVSHIYYELDHDVQEYTKRLLAKKFCTRHSRTMPLRYLIKRQRRLLRRQYF